MIKTTIICDACGAKIASDERTRSTLRHARNGQVLAVLSEADLCRTCTANLDNEIAALRSRYAAAKIAIKAAQAQGAK